MTYEIGATLTILAIALVAFASGRFAFDQIGLTVLLAVFLAGLIPFHVAFQGFANNAIITIASVYVVSEGLSRTGVAYFFGQQIRRIAGSSEVLLMIIVMVSVGILSGFMNAIGAAAVMLPAIVAAARSMDVPVSRVLLPLSYGALMGSLLTLVGTPANLLVNEYMVSRGYASFTLLDFSPLGITVLLFGTASMVIFRRWILPIRPAGAGIESMLPASSNKHQPYRLEERLYEVSVPEGSALTGKSLTDSEIGKAYGIWVLSVARADRRIPGPVATTLIRAGDHLFVSAREQDLSRFVEEFLLERHDDSEIDPGQLITESLGVVEAVITPRSSFIGKTLTEIQFREIYGVYVIAIWRDGSPRRTHLAEVMLMPGDALLIQGSPARIDSLRQERDDFVIITEEEGIRFRKSRAPLAVLILVGFVVLMMSGSVPVAVVALGAAMAMVFAGTVTMEEARQSISWSAVLLIGGMLAMAEAMTQTGTASFLAESIVGGVGGVADLTLIAVLVLTSAFAVLINNHVAAVIMIPLAIDAAINSGADPRMFTMAVALGAATGYMTPFAHPGNILVMGPGNYRFIDYMRAGLPTAIVVLTSGFVALKIMF